MINKTQKPLEVQIYNAGHLISYVILQLSTMPDW